MTKYACNSRICQDSRCAVFASRFLVNHFLSRYRPCFSLTSQAFLQSLFVGFVGIAKNCNILQDEDDLLSVMVVAIAWGAAHTLRMTGFRGRSDASVGTLSSWFSTSSPCDQSKQSAKVPTCQSVVSLQLNDQIQYAGERTPISQSKPSEDRSSQGHLACDSHLVSFSLKLSGAARTIKMRGRSESQEELTSIRIGSRVCH